MDLATDNVHHIYGPPGCGKTTALVEIAGSSLDVLLASLTKAAAREIASRSGLDSSNVGTLHSICYRALRPAPRMFSRKDVKAWNDRSDSLFKLSFEPFSREGSTAGFLDGDFLYRQCDMARISLRPIESLSPQCRNFHLVFSRFKLSRSVCDFTDLIQFALDTVPFAPGRPSLLIGDEVQDWSELELLLFRDHWGRHADAVYLAGDPDQSIYRFRGSSLDCFAHDVPVSNERFLVQSYRLSKAVCAYVRSFVARISCRVDVDFAPTSEPGSVEFLTATHYDYDVLVPLIQAELEAGRSVMFLASARNLLDFIYAALDVQHLLDSDLLTVGTIHSVKGCEADTVFVVPDYNVLFSEIPPDDLLRMFYVAVTRARTKLFLLSGHYISYGCIDWR